MADTLFIVPFQAWAYGLVREAAIRLWLGDRALLLAGLLVQAVEEWLVEGLFGPALSELTLLSQGLLPAFFTVAALLLALGYLAAPFFRVRVVSPGKALGWLLFALLFYQAGPGLYVEGEALRRSLAGELYALTLAGAGAPTGGPSAVLAAIALGPDEAMGALENQFGAFIASDRAIDGLDLAMAYTLSTGADVVYAPTPLPAGFEAAYFDPAAGPAAYLTLSAAERTASINAGLAGVGRLLLALVIIVFGLCEQAVYLCLSVAAGILFVSMAVAVLFAFFEPTEGLARALVGQWLELFILSAILAVLQAFTAALVLLGARTLNPTLTLGASCVGALVMAVLLLKAVGAIWDALNRLFRAMSQTVGGGLRSPAELGAAAAGAAGGLALTVATAGAGAALAAGTGASLAQVAGSALSGMDTLYSAAALGSFILPDESALKGTAQGFYEGALAQRLMGPPGALFLGAGGPGAGRPPGAAEAGAGQPPAPAGAEVGIRLDAGDLSALREAVSAAMAGAIAAAPPGGYRDEGQALAAVRRALAADPAASGDARLDGYLAQRAGPVGAHVLLRSQGRVSALVLDGGAAGGTPRADEEGG